MSTMVFLRSVPKVLQSQVMSGKALVAGNLIKEARSGLIVGQLQACSQQGVQLLSALVPALGVATVVLQAVNLYVTVKGFREMRQGLEKIDKEILANRQLIYDLLQGQERIQFSLEAMSQAQLMAGYRNLERSLRLGKDDLFWNGVQDLEKAHGYYKLLTNAMLDPIDGVYKQTDAIFHPLRASVVAALVLAQGYALKGETEEARALVDEVAGWLEEAMRQLHAPFVDEAALWLGALSDAEVERVERLVRDVGACKLGADMMGHQLQLCLDESLTLDQLMGKMGDSDVLVALEPKFARKLKIKATTETQ